MTPQQMMEEIDRLARLCKAKDAELAMLAEAILNARKIYSDTLPTDNPRWTDMNAMDDALALAATSETVAAWRAKETEPLLREVAIQSAALNAVFNTVHGTHYCPPYMQLVKEAICATQVTALAYEREVKAKALEEAATCLHGTGYDATLREMAAEFRARKGE